MPGRFIFGYFLCLLLVQIAVVFCAHQLTITNYPTQFPSFSPTVGGVWRLSNAADVQFYSITSSSTGQHVVATGTGLIYMSSDYGSTWIARQTPNRWNFKSVSSDSSGKYVAASFNNALWLSADYGVSYYFFQTIGDDATDLPTFVAMDSGGTRLVFAVSSVGIYVRDILASSMTLVFTSTIVWTSVCTSGTGQYLTAVSNGVGAQGGIYTSNDFGEIWTLSAYSALYSSVSCSSDGRFQAAVVTNGGIWFSSDFGGSWDLTAAPVANWVSIAVDYSGGKWIAAANGDYIYESQNYGTTWSRTSSYASALWAAVCSDSRGEQFVAVTQNQGIYYNFNATDAAIVAAIPSVNPTSQPTTEPSVQPTTEPSVQPTTEPSVQPTTEPSVQPTTEPSVQPTTEPSVQPTAQPSVQPTAQPSVQPTAQPSEQPAAGPSDMSHVPTIRPTVKPFREPSQNPTATPTITFKGFVVTSMLVVGGVHIEENPITGDRRLARAGYNLLMEWSDMAIIAAVADELNLSEEAVSIESEWIFPTGDGVSIVLISLKFLVPVWNYATYADFEEMWHTRVNTNAVLNRLKTVAENIGAYELYPVTYLSLTTTTNEGEVDTFISDKDGDDLSTGYFAGMVIGIVISSLLIIAMVFVAMKVCARSNSAAETPSAVYRV